MMIFSQTAEYALRAVVWLAGKEGAPQTSQQIAAATRVPAGYLAKVMKTLARAGLVRAQRGLGGGFTLARAPQSITPLQVIDAVDPIPRIRDCPLGFPSHAGTLCPLHSRLDAAIGHAVSALQQTTIAELVAESSGTPPLCEAPAPE